MFNLNEVVPWGRSLSEYRRMFSLTDMDLQKRILGCADGPASFNAQATQIGAKVVSFDPLFRMTASEIRQRIDTTFSTVITQTRANAQECLWSDDVPDVEALGRLRMSTMTIFLNDYEQGKSEGRYIEAGLPSLPFADDSFDITLCSHFLFLYSEQFSEDFHVDALRELSRLGPDVRIFPLLELGSVPSRHLTNVICRLRTEGFTVSLEKVDYEFQRGGNQMMKILR